MMFRFMWMVLTTECAYDNDMICQMIARLVGSKLREQQNYLRKRPSAQLVSDAPNGMRPAVLSHIVTLLKTRGENEELRAFAACFGPDVPSSTAPGTTATSVGFRNGLRTESVRDKMRQHPAE